MSIKKFKPLSPDPALGKIKGDTEFARLGHLNRLIDDTTTEIEKAVAEATNLDFKVGSIGPKVSFKKISGSSPDSNKDIIIPGLLEITRGNNGGGIYNAVVDEGYNNSAPANTLWSTPYLDANYTSWAPLWDVQNRIFDTWRNAIRTPNDNNDPTPPQYVGMPVVMACHEGGSPLPTRYWLIIFTEWGVGNNDEYGFAYDRWEILPEVYFEKPDYETSIVDKVSNGVWLARQNNGGLYNSVNEEGSLAGLSPKNTRWNSLYVDTRPGYSGFDDLSNLESRVYTSFVYALDYHVGNNIIGTELIMHDLTTDLYYKILFNGWTQNNAGGGFNLPGNILNDDMDDWRKSYELNVIGVVSLTKLISPHMIKNGGGNVVIISSMAGHFVYKGGSNYTVAKHATVALADLLRFELFDKKKDETPAVVTPQVLNADGCSCKSNADGTTPSPLINQTHMYILFGATFVSIALIALIKSNK
jgi:hypothetical protein